MGQRVLIDLFQVAVLAIAVNREPRFPEHIAQPHNVFIVDSFLFVSSAPLRGRDVPEPLDGTRPLYAGGWTNASLSPQKCKANEPAIE
jgi:hypothetical protein